MGILFCSTGPYRQKFSCNIVFLIFRAFCNFNRYFICYDAWNSFLLSGVYSQCYATLGNGFESQTLDCFFGNCAFFGRFYISKGICIENIENRIEYHWLLNINYHRLIKALLNHNIFLLILLIQSNKLSLGLFR